MSKLPQPREDLGGMLRTMRARLDALERRSPYYGTGLSPDGLGGITLQGVTLNPSAPGIIADDAAGFALTTSYATILAGILTVPAGFVTAAVTATARVFAFNDTAALDYLYARVVIGGTTGTAVPVAVPGGGGSGVNVAPLAVVLPGLDTGTPVDFAIEARTDLAGWSADVLNIADLTAAVTWFK